MCELLKSWQSAVSMETWVSFFECIIRVILMTVTFSPAVDWLDSVTYMFDWLRGLQESFRSGVCILLLGLIRVLNLWQTRSDGLNRPWS